MSQATRVIRKACLGAALLALGLQAGEAPANAPATKAAKPDSAMLAGMMAAAEASSAALTVKAAAVAELNNPKPEEKTAGATPGAPGKRAAIKDLESIRKSDEARDQERVNKLKQRIAAEISARSAAKQEYEPGSGSKVSSNSGKK